MTGKQTEALQLQNRMENLIRSEREVLNEILDLIILADSQRFYLELGYPSLFEWLTRHFNYSESAAKRRIDSARLKKSVPTLDAKIQSGAVNLSTISKVQSAVRAEESRSGSKMSDLDKAAVLEKIEGKSCFETEKILMAEFPEAQIFQKEKVRALNANEVNLQIVMSQADYELFLRAKELLSHIVPSGSPGEIVTALSREFVRRKDPLRNQTPETNLKSRSAADPDSPMKAGSRHIPNPVRRLVFKRDDGRCQAQKLGTGKRCGSLYQVEVDHIKPWAVGGAHEPANLQCLCAQHNRHRSEITFGARRAEPRVE